MNTTTAQTAAQKIAALLSTHEHIVTATASGNRVTVTFPRERGGRHTMTLPEAKKLAARLNLVA